MHCSVPRRYSGGAQHAGRGGAGNVVKDDESKLERTESCGQAVDDSGDSEAKPKKSGWFFGKKA